MTPPPQITTRAFFGSVFASYFVRSCATAAAKLAEPLTLCILRFTSQHLKTFGFVVVRERDAQFPWHVNAL